MQIKQLSFRFMRDLISQKRTRNLKLNSVQMVNRDPRVSMWLDKV